MMTWEDRSLKCFGVIQVETLAILEIGATQPFFESKDRYISADVARKGVHGINLRCWHACMHARWLLTRLFSACRR